MYCDPLRKARVDTTRSVPCRCLRRSARATRCSRRRASCICVYIYVYVCVYIHIATHSGKLESRLLVPCRWARVAKYSRRRASGAWPWRWHSSRVARSRAQRRSAHRRRASWTRNGATHASGQPPQRRCCSSSGKKINRSHTHTHKHTGREQHPRHRHTRTRQEQHSKPPNEHPQTLNNARRWRDDGACHLLRLYPNNPRSIDR